jgi:hypothetical protein
MVCTALLQYIAVSWLVSSLVLSRRKDIHSHRTPYGALMFSKLADEQENIEHFILNSDNRNLEGIQTVRKSISKTSLIDQFPHGLNPARVPF